MSVNIKLGEKTISGVDSIRVEDADTAGTYDVFSLPIRYTVSFSSNNTIIQQVSVPSGGTVNEPDDPSAEGYSLVGWFTQENGGGSEVFFPYTPTADITLYAYIVAETFITFSSDEPFDFGVYNKTKKWNGTLYTSTDKVNWTTWDGTTDVSAAKHRGKYSVSLRGSSNSVISGSTVYNGYFTIPIGGNIVCEGNIENILDYATVSLGEHPTMNSYCFSYLFASFPLLRAPKLPATTLSGYCYYNMFYKCAQLSVPPELPATQLDSNCYAYMFNGCTSLNVAPALSATSLADSCYSYMFSNSSLQFAPELPATTLATKCYQGMFASCINLITLPKLSATSLTTNCYNYMFGGCSKIKLSTTQTGDYQTEYRIPSSGSGSATSSALTNMFTSTGGTFTGTPTINTTYYTSNTIIPATLVA